MGPLDDLEIDAFMRNISKPNRTGPNTPEEGQARRMSQSNVDI